MGFVTQIKVLCLLSKRMCLTELENEWNHVFKETGCCMITLLGAPGKGCEISKQHQVPQPQKQRYTNYSLYTTFEPIVIQLVPGHAFFWTSMLKKNLL